jgi:hypothetical protein
MILTIDTLQVAMGKKNVTNSGFTADGWFFAPVNTNRRNIKGRVAFAIPCFTFQTVCVTVSRTKSAIFQVLQRSVKGVKIHG